MQWISLDIHPWNFNDTENDEEKNGYLCLNFRCVCLSDDDDDDDDDVADVAAPSIGAKEISAGVGGRRSSDAEWLLLWHVSLLIMFYTDQKLA